MGVSAMRESFLFLKRFLRYHLRSRSGTVHYAFPAVIVGALLGAALSLSDSTPSHVRVATEPAEVAAGERFSISVYATAAIPINAVDISVAYPEDQIVIEGIDVGESVITIWAVEPYARNGTIYLRGGVFRRGFLGEHLIARVRARATESGVAHILASESQFIAGDGSGNAVNVVATGAEETRVHVTRAGELKSSVSIGIVTDLDGDGDVDLTDIREFLAAWHAERFIFDFNGDGEMTFRDFGILLAYSFFH